MNLDRFSDDHMSIRFPIQDEPIEYSACAGCSEPINIGEVCLDVYGMCVHDDLYCIKRSVGATELIAGGDEY